MEPVDATPSATKNDQIPASVICRFSAKAGEIVIKVVILVSWFCACTAWQVAELDP